jgi:MSHA pilin protein MshD
VSGAHQAHQAHRAHRGHRVSRSRQARGFTLIDLLLVISVTGVIAGTMTVVFSNLAAQSAEALRSREVQALATSMLAEVKAMPFGPCDADDARARLATRAVVGAALGGCASLVDGLGAEAGESRYGASAATRFDGVSDYQGFTMPGPGCATFCDRSGAPLAIAGRLAGCSLGVAVVPQGLPGLPALDADGQPRALRIAVTVRCPGAADVVAEGVRVRRALSAQ